MQDMQNLMTERYAEAGLRAHDENQHHGEGDLETVKKKSQQEEGDQECVASAIAYLPKRPTQAQAPARQGIFR